MQETTASKQAREKTQGNPAEVMTEGAQDRRAINLEQCGHAFGDAHMCDANLLHIKTNKQWRGAPNCTSWRSIQRQQQQRWGGGDRGDKTRKRTLEALKKRRGEVDGPE